MRKRFADHGDSFCLFGIGTGIGIGAGFWFF
jgi:hypothetical protein